MRTYFFFDLPFNQKDNFKTIAGKGSYTWLKRSIWCVKVDSNNISRLCATFDHALIDTDKYQLEAVDYETALEYANFYLDNKEALAKQEKQNQIDQAKITIKSLPNNNNGLKVRWRVLYPRHSTEPIIKGSMDPYNVEYVLSHSIFSLDKMFEELDWLHETRDRREKAQKEKDEFVTKVMEEDLPKEVEGYKVTYHMEHYDDFRSAADSTKICSIIAVIEELDINCRTYMFYSVDRFYADILEGKSPIDALKKQIWVAKTLLDKWSK